ncbi:hypothetical protein Q8791_23260 [Nocardiopsis sp. CT-R113]|uniref:Uncharacterized protein n=1 Tax=Nocardiopsis codii TaxID=3065942 RepID=A0ABU7KD36_9ACTN|nr:hypothetical protein [Nocardiopsis sp. CT-R113]MEE2040141.1 hypothetical protein [Nocardiopsis sp. CT-R113]
MKGLRKPLILFCTGITVRDAYPYIEDIRQNDLSPEEYRNWALLCQCDPHDLLGMYVGGPDSIVHGHEADPVLLFPTPHLL